MRRYYPGITLFKLMGCLLVLVSHVMLLRYIGDISNQQLRFFTPLMGVIVPCFYVISGFLAYRGWSHASNPRQYVKKYLTRIALLYSFFCMIFVVEFIIPELIRHGLTISNLFLQTKILAVAVVLNGPSVQLWFIPPLLFGIFACYWLFEKRVMRLAVIIAILGFMLTLLISGSLRPILDASIDGFSNYNGTLFTYLKLFVYRYLGYGFAFVLAGVIIAKYEEKFFSARVTPFIAFTIILTIVEIVFLLKFAEWSTEYKLAISVLPNTILLFYGLIRIKSQAIQTYHKFINLFSIVMFCGHIPFMRLNLLALGWDVTEMNGLQDVVYLTLTFVECLSATIILYIRSNRRALPTTV